MADLESSFKAQVMCKSDSSTSSMAPTPTSANGDETILKQASLTLYGGKSSVAILLIPEDQYPAFESYRDDFRKEALEEQTPLLICLNFVEYLLDQPSGVCFAITALHAFEKLYLDNSDIHSLAAQLTMDEEKKLVRSYYSVHQRCKGFSKHQASALVAAASRNEAQLLAVFGGQGSGNPGCFQELANLWFIYRPLLQDLVDELSPLLDRLSRRSKFSQPILLSQWLEGSLEPPSQDILATAPFSLPLVGLIGIAHYTVACKVLNICPGVFRSRLTGTTGHSQGIIIAALISLAHSWRSFIDAAKLMVELLFWIGFHAQQETPPSKLLAKHIQDSLNHGEGHPSSLLSVRGIKRPEIDKIIQTVNLVLEPEEKVCLALINNSSNFVVAGPAHSLYGFNQYLRTIKAGEEEVQSRIPFDRRKPIIINSFLPVSAPFHTHYLSRGAVNAKKAMSNFAIRPDNFAIPIYHTRDGSDLRKSSVYMIDALIDAIMCDVAEWPTSIAETAAVTHILSFDNGSIGELTNTIKEGSGVGVVCMGRLGRSAKGLGHKSDMFATSLPQSALKPSSWREDFGPKLKRSPDGLWKVATRLTKLLGLPHVTVAGMTPTTVPWDFVSSVMNGGYHVELAGGGYYDADSMSSAIRSLVDSIPSGRGITCNIIYSSPNAIAWQIPMLRRLVKDGVPIDGLAIGAGVPSPEVAKEYIETLGLRHLTLKPGSHAAIREVIAIARAHTHFAIILQWTGGRGGGHHSYEDFHGPIIDLYAEIRQQQNIVLVAGSGFGGSEDTYPYLTGSWSESYGRPAMPFDGILLGSRMMVAKEAHTSKQAKQLICEAAGLQDESKWTGTYSKPTGGILTVKSEMGQPIHKIATRGVLFWAEMDKIFSLPQEKKLKAIESNKSDIIRRLNADFAKPFFGCTAEGSPVDVSEMTYTEILNRLVQLMYIAHQKRWIHATYQKFVRDFAIRTLERLDPTWDGSEPDLSAPLGFMSEFTARLPKVIIDADDHAYFMKRCNDRGQKPVNFVPLIDGNLERWMKKDSLWQSEDVDAVIDQDVQRICVLHGPVAARFSSSPNESCKDILDEICKAHTDMLEADCVSPSSSPLSAVPSMAKLSTSPELSAPLYQWIPAIHAFCQEEYILRGRMRFANPLRRLLAFESISMSIEDDGRSLVLSLRRHADEAHKEVVRITSADGLKLAVHLLFDRPDQLATSTLILHFQYHPDRTFYQIEELGEARNHRIKSFYSSLWLKESATTPKDPFCWFSGPTLKLTRDLLGNIASSVSRATSEHLTTSFAMDEFPLEVMIIAAWEPVIKPLLIDWIDGDLLALVHLSNKSEYYPGSTPLKVGDEVMCTSRIRSVTIQSAGKRVEVRAEINRKGRSVGAVTSAFLFRGSFDDSAQIFQQVDHPDIELTIRNTSDDAVLRDRNWLTLDFPSMPLLGKTLVFKLRMTAAGKDAETFSQLSITGSVFLLSEKGEAKCIGKVFFEATNCRGNPVLDFLERKGQPAHNQVALSQPGWDGDPEYQVTVPLHNDLYSLVSGDCNPIHTSPAFAAWADLPGTITHGMYTSAIVRHVLESVLVDGERKRFRSFSTSFTGMVFPNDTLIIKVKHEAMIRGEMVFDIQVINKASGASVLEGKAIVEQISTVYVFTGQGSQAKGMGMALYETSPIAKKVWDEADAFFQATYGWSILHLVRENPKSLTVYFGGKRGRQLRKNYLDLTIQSKQSDGCIVDEPILRELNETSMSYTFSESRGLLFSTQFAQPAITLVGKAAFMDMKSKGLVTNNSTFAGHSLGEYGALSAFTDFIPFQSLLSLVFYRGLTMQVAMERDECGHTDFSMVAANPSRVGGFFKEESLQRVLKVIATRTQDLLEIVNFNVKGEQYVCAGHLRNIDTLTRTLDRIATDKVAGAILVSEFMTIPEDEISPLIGTKLGQIIDENITASAVLPKPINLSRGVATIPLQGIDVPFHSTFLRPSVPAYRSYLRERLRPEDIEPEKFIGRFVPNVMAKPFELSSEYFEEAAKLTGSEVLKGIAERERPVEVAAAS